MAGGVLPRCVERAAVLATVKARPGVSSAWVEIGATAGLDGVCAQRRLSFAVEAEECSRCGSNIRMA